MPLTSAHILCYGKRVFSFLVLFALAVASSAHAQTVIRGSVRDSTSGDPLFMATLRVENSFRATITNAGGIYELELDALPATVIATHIGYATVRLHINQKSAAEQHILMQPVAYELEELVVTPGNLAADIMQKVIRRKQAWRAGLNTLSADAYTRFSHENETGIVAIIESLSEAFWRREKGWREIVKAKRQTENVRFKDYLPAAMFVTNLYDDNIEISGHSLMGVTHPDALDAYDFDLTGRRFLDDKIIYDISVTPKNDRASAFTGHVAVLHGEYALIEADLQPNARAFLFPPPIRAIRLSYKQRFSNFGTAFWLPVGLQVTAELDIGMVGLTFPPIKTNQISRLANYRINTPVPDSLYRQKKPVVVDSLAVKNDSLLTREGAVVPLREEETEAYAAIDSSLTLEKAFKPSGFLARFVKIEEDGGKPQRRSGLRLRPDVWYNRVDAAHIGLRAKAGADRLEVAGASAYNTGTRRWAYGGGLNLRLGKKKRGILEIDYRKGSDTRYVSDLYSRRDTGTLMLLGGKDYFDYFWNERLRTRLGYRPFGADLRLSAGLNVERHASLAKTTDYALFGNRTPRENPPVTPGNLRALAFDIVYNPPSGPQGAPPDAPPAVFGQKKIRLGIEHSRPGLLSSDFSFTQYKLELDWRFKTFHRRRFLANVLDLRIVAGTASGTLPPQRFGHIDAGLDGFNTFGAFRTLQENPYEGERYAALFWEHNFRTLPFEWIGQEWLVKRGIGLILHGGHGRTWISDARLASLPYTPQYQDRFHHEIGISINALLGILRLDVTRRLDTPKYFVGLGIARLF